jgi:hypothetical protein
LDGMTRDIRRVPEFCTVILLVLQVGNIAL